MSGTFIKSQHLTADELQNTQHHCNSNYRGRNLHWLDDLPRHWSAKRLKYIASSRPSNIDKKTVEGQLPVQLCNYVDVYKNDYITADLPFMAATAEPTQVARFRLRKGDVLITKDSEDWRDIAVPAFVAEDFDSVVCGYHLTLVRPNPQIVDGEYLFRAFQANGVNQQFQVAANGITRFGLSIGAITDALFPIPPLDEQQAIAAFLDRETARIDALIAKKERMIELLQEKHTAIISHFVTKGIDPTNRLKHSGISWIGTIPQHWSLKKLGMLARVVRGASPRPAGDVRYFNGNAVPWTTVADVTKDTSKYLEVTETMLTREGALLSRFLQAGTLILTNSGATLGVPKILAIDSCANDGIVAFLDISSIAQLDYLYVYLLSTTSMYRERIKQGQGQPNLNTSIVKNTPIPLPPLQEQSEIVATIDRETKQLNQCAGRIVTAIERLREYRSALISAAVTGKIDVRKHGETASCQ